MRKRIFTVLIVSGTVVIIAMLIWLIFFRPMVIPFTGAGETKGDGMIRMEALYPVYDSSCEYMTVIITNESGINAEFGNAWNLEKNVMGSWMQVQRAGTYAVESILHILSSGEKYAFGCRLTGFVGTLENGKYRIVKEINDETYSAEFEIGESNITLAAPFGYSPAPVFGYSNEDAEAERVCVLGAGTISHEDKLIAFLEASQISGLQTQVRLCRRTEDGKIYYTDIVKTKHPHYRVISWEQTELDRIHRGIFTSSDSHAINKYSDEMQDRVSVKFYNSLTSDGHGVWLSAYSDLSETAPDKNDICIIPEECVTAAVQEWMEDEAKIQSEYLIYAVWNNEGTRKVNTRANAADEEERRTYFVNLYSDNGHAYKGYTCGIRDDVFDIGRKGGIREFVWIDEKIVMVCADNGEDYNYYEFYDTEEEKRISYTMSEYDYRIENGEVIIPE